MKKQNIIKKAAAAAIAAATLASGMTFSSSAQSGDFDESNIVLRFGVLSDIHLSGSWNIETSREKLDKAYKTLLALAGKKADGSTKLDAVFIDGDIVDAMNSSGNIGSGNKLDQNYKELSAFRDISLGNFNQNDKTGNVAIIYANGNHDCADGVALDENKQKDTTGFYSPTLYQKIFSGYTWKSTIPSDLSGKYSDIYAYNKAMIKEYDAKSGEYYDFFYGNDLADSNIDYGNRIAKVGGYYFLTVEPQDYATTYRTDTIEWLDEMLEKITEAEPDKAVFVATHARVRDTIFSSAADATSALVPVLEKYPQVIIWGGHEHSALNRELAIYQDKFTCVDAGVVQYLSGQHVNYVDNAGKVANAKNFGGYNGYEYRNFSQGEYVEVDADGNIRIRRIDFFNSDLEKGDIKEIEYPWIISDISSSGSHLNDYNKANIGAGNVAPAFASGAKLSAVLDEETSNVTVSFPAAVDDLRVISYYLSVTGKESGNVGKYELTSYYYDHANAHELDSETYTHTLEKLPKNEELTVSVYAIDDFGAQSAALSTEVFIESKTPIVYPPKEFDITKLNTGGYSGTVNSADYNTSDTFGGKSCVSIKKNANTTSNIIMNNYTRYDMELNRLPYMVITYYYKHDSASAKAAAPKMRWRFFPYEGSTPMQITKEVPITTNEWTNCVVDLSDSLSLFALENYKLGQFKFDPFGTTAGTSLDDGDIMYISSIKFMHEPAAYEAEDGVCYVSASGYIPGIHTVYTKIADAIAALGKDGGTVKVYGDITIASGADFEVKKDRGTVTVEGIGTTLAEKQKNRIFMQKTSSFRTIPFGGTTKLDNITIKAPTDEAGLHSQGQKLILGENVAVEKTVKGATDIDAEGTKNMSLNFGGNYEQSSDSTVEVYGGSYGDVSTFYMWSQATITKGGNNEYTFFGGTFSNVFSGVRNSSTGILTVNGDVHYTFRDGVFGNVFAGHYKNGVNAGNTVYDIYGGKFDNGVVFGSFAAPSPADAAKLGNTAVIVYGKNNALSAPVKVSSSSSKAVQRNTETSRFIVISNNAEENALVFDSSLDADYKLKVFGGCARPVFSGKTLSGFEIISDVENADVLADGVKLAKNAQGLYMPDEKDGIIEITFKEPEANDLEIDTVYEKDPQDSSHKFTVMGAQIRIPDENAVSGLRFVCRTGLDVLSKFGTLHEDNKKPLSKDDTGIGYGFVVIPEDLLSGELDKNTDNAHIVPAARIFAEGMDYIEYTVCITGTPVEKYGRKYVVRPYITYKDASGNIKTAYGDAYAASVIEVAETACDNDDDNKQIIKESIIDEYEAL